MKVLLLATMLLLGGCSMKEAPPMKVYALVTPSVAPVASGRYSQKILKVAYPSSLGEKLGTRMIYSYSPTDRGEYLNSRWSNELGRLLEGNIVSVLSQSRLFRVVVPFNSDIDEDLVLESTVFDFSHYVRGEASYAVVSIQFTLMDTKTGKLLKARRFSYRESTPTVNARGYVEATNRIMARLDHDLMQWLN